MSGAVAKERLFWNVDRTKLVKEDDPAARFLAVTPGHEIPEVPTVKAAPKSEDKAAPAPANKAATVKKTK